MEGLVADHNFITSHVSDVEMRRNSGCDFFFSLALLRCRNLSLSLSLGRSRGNIDNYVSRPILNRCLTKSKSLSTRNFSLRILTYLDFFYRAVIFFRSRCCFPLRVETFTDSLSALKCKRKGKKIENDGELLRRIFFVSSQKYMSHKYKIAKCTF